MLNKGITTRQEDYSQWYLDVIERAELVENSVVRGCMVFKPYGFALWENIRDSLNQIIKDTGHKNAYFPLFIPKSFLSREASHVKGFAKECAIVTHHRLIENEAGDGVVVDPKAKLEEELIIRPTSETIMYDTFSRWVTSWRDLPLLINQWANVVRWEKRTRPFLRTSEFLWQEGHTVHATHEESLSEVLKMLKVYADFAEEYLAIPSYMGKKSESERFAGALNTYTVENLMQDNKALQFGTSHDLGQNFAKAFNIEFVDKDGEKKYGWQTSWGVSTRMIGGLIMSHSDDKGLIIPPKVAPIKAVIIPIYKDENKDIVLEFANNIYENLKTSISDIEMDDRDYLSPGFKFNEWEKKGVPVRIEIGPKDVEKNSVVLVRRDTGEKEFVELENINNRVVDLLENIQNNLLEKAKERLVNNTHEVDNYDEFKDILNKDKGFIKTYWCGSTECEDSIKNETKATTRCLAEENTDKKGKCIYCGKECSEKWYFAISY